MFNFMKKNKNSPLVAATYKKVDLFTVKDHLCLNHLIAKAREVTTEKALLKDADKKNLVCSYAINFCMAGSPELKHESIEKYNATTGLNLSDEIVNAILKLNRAEYERFVKEVIFNKNEYREE